MEATVYGAFSVIVFTNPHYKRSVYTTTPFQLFSKHPPLQTLFENGLRLQQSFWETRRKCIKKYLFLNKYPVILLTGGINKTKTLV